MFHHSDVLGVSYYFSLSVPVLNSPDVSEVTCWVFPVISVSQFQY